MPAGVPAAGADDVVVEVYSNSSSAPNSASSTFLRSPSQSASASAGADEREQELAAEPAAALLLGRLAQRDAGVAQRLGRALEVLLELLVVEEPLVGRLAVAQPLVGARADS